MQSTEAIKVEFIGDLAALTKTQDVMRGLAVALRPTIGEVFLERFKATNPMTGLAAVKLATKLGALNQPGPSAAFGLAALKSQTLLGKAEVLKLAINQDLVKSLKASTGLETMHQIEAFKLAHRKSPALSFVAFERLDVLKQSREDLLARLLEGDARRMVREEARELTEIRRRPPAVLPVDDDEDQAAELAPVIPLTPADAPYTDPTNTLAYWGLSDRPLGHPWPHLMMIVTTWSGTFLSVADEVRALLPDRSERDVQLIAFFAAWTVTLAMWQVYDRYLQARRDDED